MYILCRWDSRVTGMDAENEEKSIVSRTQLSPAARGGYRIATNGEIVKKNNPFCLGCHLLKATKYPEREGQTSGMRKRCHTFCTLSIVIYHSGALNLQPSPGKRTHPQPPTLHKCWMFAERVMAKKKYPKNSSSHPFPFTIRFNIFYFILFP